MDSPQAVAEIRRILLMNLGIRENRPSTANLKVEFFRRGAFESRAALK
jgi:hypothetical protein